jgi:hypothetical protein
MPVDFKRTTGRYVPEDTLLITILDVAASAAPSQLTQLWKIPRQKN